MVRFRKKKTFCKDCEFSCGTKNSSFMQCHMKYDYSTGEKSYANKTQRYVSGEDKSCKHFQEYFDWSKLKIEATQGDRSETLNVLWQTRTFLNIKFLGKKIKLRKSDFAKDDTICLTRPNREFKLIK